MVMLFYNEHSTDNWIPKKRLAYMISKIDPDYHQSSVINFLSLVENNIQMFLKILTKKRKSLKPRSKRRTNLSQVL
jgi:hypothetical protein